ncbi:MAG: Na+/H+ antiporter subunit E [Bradymonadaceae bacterium]|nr:Na+/H+ antiporter subunit E [Lujinxingiaceae bacterium]
MSEHEGRPVDVWWGSLVRSLPRLMVFALLWMILTGAQASSWRIGVPIVLVATAWSLSLVAPGTRLSPRGIARFVPFFLARSVVGSIDVARRALLPSMPIAPAMVRYRPRLAPSSAPAIFFINAISLLPGTLCASLEAANLHIHVVDDEAGVFEGLAELEEHVAAMFGVEISAREELGGPE